MFREKGLPHLGTKQALTLDLGRLRIRLPLVGPPLPG
jgi:hypothetical protein